MASYDGSRLLEVGCDVFCDHECGPCSVGGTRKEAKHFCQECQDYLCDSCKGYHGKLAVTRNHNIVSGSEILPVQVPVKQKSSGYKLSTLDSVLFINR